MQLAIMQPYLFPYIGYYQLVAAADSFVFYDDVNYIKNGWINRNRLLLSGAVHYFTVPLSDASPFQKIHEVKIQANDIWRRKMRASIRQSYAKAPQFTPVFELASAVIDSTGESLADMAKESVLSVARYLGLATEFVWSSAIYSNSDLSGPERVLDICHRMEARRYINLPGGRNLYDPARFSETGVALEFLEPHLRPYRQNKEPFVAGLSIIDVLMWNDIATVRAMLGRSMLSKDSAGTEVT